MIESIKLTFRNKESISTLCTGLNSLYLLNFENIDYLTYYNFRRFYKLAKDKIESYRFRKVPPKGIVLTIELNIYATIRDVLRNNSQFLKHEQNSYLQIIALDIINQGEIFLEQKQTVYDAQNYGF